MSQGPLAPTTCADDAAVGTSAWGTPGNATADDASYASILAKNVTTHYLKATDFGFSIPSGATIDGIVVEWKRKAFSQTATIITDSSLKLVKGGVIGGTNKSSAATWTTAENWISFGGASDLWGETWSDTDINDSTFGTVLSAAIANGFGTNQAAVNACRITVYYTAGGGGGTVIPVFMNQYRQRWA